MEMDILQSSPKTSWHKRLIQHLIASRLTSWLLRGEQQVTVTRRNQQLKLLTRPRTSQWSGEESAGGPLCDKKFELEKGYNEHGVSYVVFANDTGLYPSPERQFFFHTV